MSVSKLAGSPGPGWTDIAILRFRVPPAAELEQVQAHGFKLRQQTVQRHLVTQRPGEQGVSPLRLRAQSWERAEHRFAQQSADAELAPHRFRCLVHGSIVADKRERTHRTDRVSAAARVRPIPDTVHSRSACRWRAVP
jgi:hypothetical protein